MSGVKVPFDLTSVLHDEGDLLGKLLALVCLSPVYVYQIRTCEGAAVGLMHALRRRFIVVMLVTLVASRRDLQTISFLMSQVCYALLYKFCLGALYF